MTNKTKHHGQKDFGQYCLQFFSNLTTLESHVKNSLGSNHTKSVLIPAENKRVNFQNFIKLILKQPMVVYGNFKCVLISSTNSVDFGPNTKKYQDHIVCIYDYKLICVDDRFSKPCNT